MAAYRISVDAKLVVDEDTGEFAVYVLDAAVRRTHRTSSDGGAKLMQSEFNGTLLPLLRDHSNSYSRVRDAISGKQYRR